MQDNYRHKGLRRRLVENLEQKGIQSPEVLEAIFKVPRHFFMDKAFEEMAYEDKAFPIDADQTISQPFTVAYQTELLEVKKRDKILEIGTGSGYQACILAELGARVYTVERQKSLHLKAREMFDLFNYAGVRSYFRDGHKGLPEFAPFDKIIVTAAAISVPTALTQQLAVGGILVIPIGDEQGQRMFKIVKKSETEFEEIILDKFRFVPFLKGKVY